MSHQTYNDKWARAVEDLKELLQLEEDCSQLPETSQEAAIFNPKVTRLYVRYVLVTNEVEECHHYVTQPQKRLHIRKLLDGLLMRIIELKKLVIDTSPREGCPHLYITDVLSYLDATPEQALLRLPRYLRDDPAIADKLDVKMQKLKYWATTLRGSLGPHQRYWYRVVLCSKRSIQVHSKRTGDATPAARPLSSQYRTA